MDLIMYCLHTHTHTHRLLTDLTEKSGRKCLLIQDQLMTCTVFPVPNDLVRSNPTVC